MAAKCPNNVNPSYLFVGGQCWVYMEVGGKAVNLGLSSVLQKVYWEEVVLERDIRKEFE
ncbi:hypothetical protein BY996DRAFT_6536515 [Phakopsora pachyrhizi]|nr:hypothetical protein BY996DRAFT_6536515 [Phakopsora pachyrhizi]